MNRQRHRDVRQTQPVVVFSLQYSLLFFDIAIVSVSVVEALVLEGLKVSIVDGDLAGAQQDLVADVGEVLFVLFKDALEPRLELEGGEGS